MSEDALFYLEADDLPDLLALLRKEKVRAFEAFGVKVQFADEAFHEIDTASPSSLPDLDDDESNEEMAYASSE